MLSREWSLDLSDMPASGQIKPMFDREEHIGRSFHWWAVGYHEDDQPSISGAAWAKCKV